MMTSTSHDVNGNNVKTGNDFGVTLDDSIVLSTFNNTSILEAANSPEECNFKAEPSIAAMHGPHSLVRTDD